MLKQLHSGASSEAPLACQQLEFALAYARRGFRVLPINAATKIPCDPATGRPLPDWQNVATADPDTLRSWFTGRPHLGLGTATGRRSGIVVVDVDTKVGKKGKEGLAYLESRYGELPTTLTATTPSGGRHLLFAYPKNFDGTIRNFTSLGKNGFGRETHVDIRGDGGQINAAPTERDGVQYEWTTAFESTELAELPAAWIELLVGGESGRSSSPNPRSGNVEEGSRNARLTSYLGGHRAKGATEEELVALGLAWNELYCVPPLPREEVERTARGMTRYDPSIVGAWDELGNARRFVDKFENEVRFAKGGGWLVADEQAVWHRDEKKLDVMQLMMTIADDVGWEIDQSAAAMPSAVLKGGKAWVKKSRSLGTIQHAIELAASDPRIRNSINDFDSDPDVFAVENALIDLRSGVGRDLTPADLITNAAPVTYDPSAKAPRWLRFVDQTFNGDRDLIRAVQGTFGHFLTGRSSEHKIWVAHGAGRNGKGVLFGLLRQIAGGHARTASRDTFIMKDHQGIPNDLAALRGGRLVVCDEFPLNKRPNEELLKQLSGGDPVTARFLYGEEFTYLVGFKMVLITNTPLAWSASNYALWERLVEIPFEVTIPAEDRNPHLKEELWEERSGILNWLLEGAVDYYANGLRTPEKMKKATAAARTEVDTVRPFIDETLKTCPGGKVPVGDLHNRYRTWCLVNGGRWVNTAEFKSYLERELGLANKRGGPGGFWLDVEYAVPAM